MPANDLPASVPLHAILGEEFGLVGDRGATWRWVIDPIDGTRSFVRGNETWATLIALQRDGKSVVGVASAPAMRLRFHATLGGGAFLNGRRIHVSKIANISEALITHTAIRGFVITKQAERLVGLAGRCWDARGIGNSMSHLAVARGTADIGWTSRANVWDYAALKLVVTEAGGRFTDRSGGRPEARRHRHLIERPAPQACARSRRLPVQGELVKIGTIRDGTTSLPALIDGDRAYRLDDLLGALGGVPVTVPDGADAASVLASRELAVAARAAARRSRT